MANPSRSETLWQEAQRVVPKGTHSDSRRADPYPLYLERAAGAMLYDVDGRAWMDCKMGNGAVILGHGDPTVDAAVKDAIDRGLGAGYECDLAIRAASLMHELLGVERVRFANSGTEAAMHALMMARARTGRDRIAKPEGGYDGWYDLLWVSTWGAPDQIGPAEAPLAPPGTVGLSRHASETLVLPFNNIDATVRLLRQHRDELAAFILEPTLIDIGYVPADPAYLRAVRETTAELGIALIFDELLTGFRLPGNSAAACFGVEPDLSIFGKAIGNGYIVAAVAGKAAFMEAEPQPQFVGTFNSHAVSMAAVCATLELLRDGAVLAKLDALSDRLGSGLRELARHKGIPMQYQGRGGHFHLYFNDRPVTDYRSALASNPARYTAIARQFASDGILIANKYLLHSALSAAHTEADIDRILQSAERAFAAMR